MQKGNVFVIMPFEDKFYETYEILRRKFEKDFKFSHAGDIQNQQNILKDIIHSISDADVIIADLTGLNSNVFYELGIAHALNKKVIIITENINSLPFDLKSYRAKEYSKEYTKFEELIQTLDNNLNGAVTGEVIFSNPVTDFLTFNNAKTTTKNANIINIEIETEKGYLDFIAEIEENTNSLTSNIINMSKDIEKLCRDAEETSENINKVTNNKYDSGSASFIRKQAKKMAFSFNEFSSKLRTYNDENNLLWNKIEKDSFGMIENTFTLKDENKDNLIEFLASMLSLKTEIAPRSEAVNSFMIGLDRLMGMEKTLNQSLRFCKEDLSNFLNLMSQISTSIDRLINKSKFIVGDLSLEQIK